MFFPLRIKITQFPKGFRLKFCMAISLILQDFMTSHCHNTTVKWYFFAFHVRTSFCLKKLLSEILFPLNSKILVKLNQNLWKCVFSLWHTGLWFEVIKIYSLAKDDKRFPCFVKMCLSKTSKLNDKENIYFQIKWKRSCGVMNKIWFYLFS